jgi:hypothetical protein
VEREGLGPLDVVEVGVRDALLEQVLSFLIEWFYFGTMTSTADHDGPAGVPLPVFPP